MYRDYTKADVCNIYYIIYHPEKTSHVNSNNSFHLSVIISSRGSLLEKPLVITQNYT